jgi:hypothetical protein
VFCPYEKGGKIATPSFNSQISARPSPALRIPTIQARLTPIHQHQRLRIALLAQRGTRRKPGSIELRLAVTRCGSRSIAHRVRSYIGFLGGGGFVGGAFVGDELAGGFVHLRVVDHADVFHVLLHHRADFGDDAGHVDAAGLEVAAAGVEHSFHLLHQEGDVAAFAEHGGHDAGERHDPLEVVHVFRVDEDLEGAALLVRRAGVEHDVVDGDVERVLEQRRLDLEGGADEGVGTLHAFVHLDHFGHRRLFGGHGGRDRGGGNLVFGFDHVVAGDLFVDFGCHDVLLCWGVMGRWMVLAGGE